MQAADTATTPPAWDACGWHYAADADADGPLTAQYVLVLDALNFCFWPSTTAMEYDALATTLTRVLTADAHAFDAPRLAALTADELAAWFTAGGHHLPAAEERARKLNEVGSVLAARYGGAAANLVRAAAGSAVELVRLVTAELPGFRDESLYRGRQVFLYKRAQIFVADLWAAYGQRSGGASPYAFHDMARLTCFADYRIPQLLRGAGVLTYAPALAAAVDARTPLAAGSEWEVEIRAATVVAVERLLAAIAAGRPADAPPLHAVHVDWLLWQEGERLKDTLAPHHRTLTVFY